MEKYSRQLVPDIITNFTRVIDFHVVFFLYNYVINRVGTILDKENTTHLWGKDNGQISNEMIKSFHFLGTS